MQGSSKVMTVLWAGSVVALLSMLSACGATPQDVKELREKQVQILTKLGDIDKKIEKIASRPAAAPARRRTGPDPDKVYNLPVAKSAIRGPKDAPITLVEFSDFQCPFCSRTVPLIDQVLAAYPTQVRFVYKQFPLISIHKNAMPAALATVAAQRQGKFWEMHDKLFANQRALGADNLRKYAEEIGLDVAKFEADMKSAEVKQQVQEDMRLASTVQIRGTPTLFVNGKLVQNRSLDGFKAVIDPILKAKGKG